MGIEERILNLSDDPDVNLSSLIDTMILEEAVNKLTSVQQAVISLDMAGFKQWEISEILGISRTTVWSKKTHALVSLKDFITNGTIL